MDWIFSCLITAINALSPDFISSILDFPFQWRFVGKLMMKCGLWKVLV